LRRRAERRRRHHVRLHGQRALSPIRIADARRGGAPRQPQALYRADGGALLSGHGRGRWLQGSGLNHARNARHTTKTPGASRGLRVIPWAGEPARIAGSGDLEVFGGRLSAIGDKLVLNRLAFVERVQASALHGRNVDEYILVAGLRPDEPVTLRRIKPLDGAFLHRRLLSLQSKSTRNVRAALRATTWVFGRSDAIAPIKQ